MDKVNMAENTTNRDFQPSCVWVKPSSYVTFGVIENCYSKLNCCPELQNNYPKQICNHEQVCYFVLRKICPHKQKCHPEFISGSDQLKIPWKTRHFSRNQEISEKVVKRVRNDMKDQVQHDIKERNNSSKTTERNSKMNIIKKVQKAVAFTLAETLVVMGIIGVVAALTIPNLNQSTGDREKVAKLKKIYANLNDAYGRATAVYGPIEEWCQGINDNSVCSEKSAERLIEFLKISKKYDDQRYSLADGSIIQIAYDGGNSTSSSYPNEILYLMIDVDIDGDKGKNLYGYDRFYFVTTENGLFPDDTSEKTGEDVPAYKNSDDYYATAWVIQNGNMDYLKCFDELNWKDKFSCK